MTSPYDVSIVIVNWNSQTYLRDCLKSIEETCRSIRVETILVDNASYDGSVEMCNVEFPHVKTIQLPLNRGFASANNIAAEKAGAPLILFLNPDTILLNGAISELIKGFRSSEDIAIAGSKLFNGNGTLQTSCVLPYPGILRQILEFEWLIKKTAKWKFWGVSGLYANDGPTTVEAVSGACLMISRDQFKLVQGFSNDYFMYTEDIDLCYKIQRLGKRVLHVPNSRVIHFGGGSTRSSEAYSHSTILMICARYLFIKKYYGHLKAHFFRISITLFSILRLFIAYSIKLLLKFEVAGTIQKWNALLRWSIGLEKWAESTHKNLISCNHREAL